MSKYFLRRLLQGIPTFFGVTLISFLLMLAAPGDPIDLITVRPDSNPETAATLTNPPPSVVQTQVVSNVPQGQLLPSYAAPEQPGVFPIRPLSAPDAGFQRF